MKNTFVVAMLALLALIAFQPDCAAFSLLGTGFTYQGALKDGAGPANGVYDLQFTIYDSTDIPGTVIAGPLTNSAVNVSNGLFTVTVDFGTNISTAFNLSDRWMEIGARTNGAGTFIALTPRQRIAATPYAFAALNAGVLLGNLPATQLSGTINNGSLPSSPNFSGTVAASSFSGSGANVTSLNAGNISGGSLNDARLSGNVALLNASQTFSGPNTFNGNVGVGTGSPSVPLNVNGNARIDATSVAYQEGLSLNLPTDMLGGGYGGIHFHNGPRGGAYDLSTIKWGIFYNYTPEFNIGGNGLAFAQDNANTRLYLSTNGNVGVGTAFPQRKLDVAGDINLLPGGGVYAGNTSLLRADGYQNTFVGIFAGNPNVSNYDNVAVGSVALNSDTSGAFNTALGAGALYLNTKGSNNTASGFEALRLNTIGNDNTASGYEALYTNSIGSANTANGYQALYSNINGKENTASGAQALYFNTTGQDNTATGTAALYSNTTGTDNTANGAGALYSNTNGAQNTASGYTALYSNTGGFYNTADGAGALYANTTGVGNTANGFQTLYFNTFGADNSATGYKALYANVGGIRNVADGEFALFSNTGGSNNTAVGYAALYSNVNGSGNTAHGIQALYSNTSGVGNTGNGYQALYSDAGGIYNTACGYQALYSNPDDVGGVAVGYQSLYSCTNGTANTSIGYQALHNLKYGGGNVALGYSAGLNLTNGYYNIYIGASGVKDETNVTRVANIYGTTIASGVDVLVSPSGQLGTLTSSERFKQNIRGMGDASEVLLSLRPVEFRYKPDLDPQGIPQFGLIAEEVEKVDPNLVARDDKNQIYTVRYQAVSAMLLNEFLKQHKKVVEQNKEIRNLNERVEAGSQNSESRIQRLEAENAELKARLEKIERMIGSKYTAGQ